MAFGVALLLPTPSALAPAHGSCGDRRQSVHTSVNLPRKSACATPQALVAFDANTALCYTDSMSTVDNLSERLEFLQGTLEVLILRSLQMGPNHAYGIGQFIEHYSDS